MDTLGQFATDLEEWYQTKGRSFIESYAPDRVSSFDSEVERIRRLREATNKDIQVCFLGNSGIGKSTLINALVAREQVILPQGGIGPLTAQAVSVRASDEPFLRATYLHSKQLNKSLFILERFYERELRKAGAQLKAAEEDPTLGLDEESLKEADLAVPDDSSPEAASTGGELIEDLKKRSRLLLFGSQWGDQGLPQLLDGLRLTLGYESRWDAELPPDVISRVEVLKRALDIARQDGVHETWARNGQDLLRRDLEDHAKGFLAPIIRTLEVGWSSEVLQHGAVLIDLPGLGIANDEYQTVTRGVIRDAKMVVLVVDRSGLAESSANLLHSSGFLNALLHDSHDPASEPVTLLIVMSKVDDIAGDNRRADREQNGKNALSWSQHFEKCCIEADKLIRDQARRELQKLVDNGPDATRGERQGAVDRILETLRVHPVSAPQYRLFYLRDPEEPAFIHDPEVSRLPRLAADLKDLIQQHGLRTREHLRAATREYRSRIVSTVELIRAQWSDDSRTEEELERLRTGLEEFVAPIRKELGPRNGAFREFLNSTIPTQIEDKVDIVAAEARIDIARYLRRYHDYHWATLRAAVRHGGAFVGARTVDLPSELTLRFEEPIAVVWSKHILAELRKRTRELSDDYIQMLDQIVSWGKVNGARFQPRLLESVREQLVADARLLASVGKDAIDDLKANVKKELTIRIQSRIRSRCAKFVEEKKDFGPGVKQRILELLRDELSDSVVEGAKPAALRVLPTKLGRRSRTMEIQ
jgi:Dynamin family